MGNWTRQAAVHSLTHRMDDGLFVTGLCAYCGLTTIDYCPACGIFVCRQCDVREHWPAAGILPTVGFAVEPYRVGGRFRH